MERHRRPSAQNKISDFLGRAGRQTQFLHQLARQHPALQRFLSTGIIPAIESKYRVPREGKIAAITGVSMGGYGALRFAFAHPELFSAVSAQSAALITQTPKELSSAGRSGTPLGRLLGPAFGEPVNLSHWNEIVFSRWPERTNRDCKITQFILTAASKMTSGSKTAQPPCTNTYNPKGEARVSFLSRRPQPSLFPVPHGRSHGVSFPNFCRTKVVPLSSCCRSLFMPSF